MKKRYPDRIDSKELIAAIDRLIEEHRKPVPLLDGTYGRGYSAGRRRHNEDFFDDVDYGMQKAFMLIRGMWLERGIQFVNDWMREAGMLDDVAAARYVRRALGYPEPQ